MEQKKIEKNSMLRISISENKRNNSYKNNARKRKIHTLNLFAVLNPKIEFMFNKNHYFPVNQPFCDFQKSKFWKKNIIFFRKNIVTHVLSIKSDSRLSGGHIYRKWTLFHKYFGFYRIFPVYRTETIFFMSVR